MKSLRTKVILSAFVLLFALVATIGSTYAWFTVSSTVSVDSMNINVITEDSLLIKVVEATDDAEVGAQNISAYNFTIDDFYNSVTNAELATTYPGLETGALSPYLLTPVTVAAGETSGLTDYASFNTQAFRDMALGSTGDATRTYSAAASNNTTTGGYIEIRFWLMVQNGTDVTVELSAFNASSTGGVVENALYLATYAETETTQNVYPYGSDWAFTFVPGEAGYRTPTTSLNAVQTIAALQLLEKTAGADDVVVTLTENVPEIVSVYIWIEGWDAQATNSIMGQDLDLDFTFTIIPA